MFNGHTINFNIFGLVSKEVLLFPRIHGFEKNILRLSIQLY